MYCISINHKNNNAKIREKYALDCEEQERFLESVRSSENISGAVLLMTCNRCEIYFTGNKHSMDEAERIFVKVKGCDIDSFREVSMRYDKKSSIRHLYMVACGLDSAVLGEVEIIRQVKSAYLFSKERCMTNSELNIVFQGALGIAKDVADTSDMTRLPISVGTLTMGEALRFCEDREEPHIFIVGASGEIGSIIMKDLSDYGSEVKIVGTSRKHRKDSIEFADTENTKWVHYDKRYEYIEWADVIISATSSPHYTFLAKNICKYVNDGKKRLFIDLAIPRDIEEEIGKISSCTLHDIDYIKELAKENNDKRVNEAKKVEILVKKKSEDTEKVLIFRDFVENNGSKMEYLKKKDAAWLLYYIREHVDFDSFKKILDTLEDK